MKARMAMRMALLVALPALAAMALVTWEAGSGSRDANAAGLAAGLDFNTSGTPVSGVYNPASLPTFESCVAAPLGGTVSIDVFVLDVQNLIAFQSDIQYDGSKLTLVGSQAKLFMGTGTVQNPVLNLSQNGPDAATGVLATPDTDGLYEAGALDAYSSHSGYGVMARLTFQGIASGLATVALPTLDNDGNTTVDTGVVLTDNTAPPAWDHPGDADHDGWFDPPFTNQQGIIAITGDTDGDGVPDAGCGGVPDNCPGVANPTQADLDLDGQGDACDGDIDADGYWNTQEQGMGSNASNALSTPEVCDGVNNDQDGLTDEGYDYNSNGTPDCSDATANTDGDGTMNPTDTDDDNDGFSDLRENWMGINSLRRCPPDNTGGTSYNHYAWATDTTNDQFTDISDVVLFRPPFFSFKGGTNAAAYNARFDLDASGEVDISDVVMLRPTFFTACTYP